MPGLLTVGVPYVTEAYAERIGSRAMGLYVSALVLGGLVGRVGVALLTAATSWRVALGAVAALPLAATLVMRRSLPPEAPGPPSAGLSAATLRRLLANRALVAACLDGRGPVLLLHGRLLVHRLPPRAPAVLALAGGHRARLRAVGHGRRRAARGAAGRPSRLAGGRARRPAAVRRRADAVARAGAGRRHRRALARDAGQLLGRDRRAARRRRRHRSRPRRGQRHVLQRLLRGRRARRLRARAGVGAVALDRRVGDGARGLRHRPRRRSIAGGYPGPSVRSFSCATCGQLVFFENTACLRCGSELGFDWERRERPDPERRAPRAARTSSGRLQLARRARRASCARAAGSRARARPTTIARRSSSSASPRRPSAGCSSSSASWACPCRAGASATAAWPSSCSPASARR